MGVLGLGNWYTLSFRNQPDWGWAAGFLHENRQRWNEGGLADNEAAEDSENDLLWNVGPYASAW